MTTPHMTRKTPCPISVRPSLKTLKLMSHQCSPPSPSTHNQISLQKWYLPANRTTATSGRGLLHQTKRRKMIYRNSHRVRPFPSQKLGATLVADLCQQWSSRSSKRARVFGIFQRRRSSSSVNLLKTHMVIMEAWMSKEGQAHLDSKPHHSGCALLVLAWSWISISKPRLGFVLGVSLCFGYDTPQSTR